MNRRGCRQRFLPLPDLSRKIEGDSVRRVSSFVFIQPIIEWIYLQHTRMAAHLPAVLFLLPAATKNNAAKFFLSLKQNNSEFFNGAP